jgi:hypothetical protein
MAQGELEVTHEVLEKAAQLLPDSQRINEEVQRSRHERALLSTCSTLIEEKSFANAKEILDELAKVSSNINLLRMAASLLERGG